MSDPVIRKIRLTRIITESIEMTVQLSSDPYVRELTEEQKRDLFEQAYVRGFPRKHDETFSLHRQYGYIPEGPADFEV